jgi:mRNA-degrading endonuclease RelE of RelBE toxin-antitoxin system
MNTLTRTKKKYSEGHMAWSVTFSAKVAKKSRKLPEGVRKSLVLLAAQIEEHGPVRGDWPNYSKLGPRRHHCHIRKGRPTYVAVWEECGKRVNLVEVIYVGTHEKAPY